VNEECLRVCTIRLVDAPGLVPEFTRYPHHTCSVIIQQKSNDKISVVVMKECLGVANDEVSYKTMYTVTKKRFMTIVV
jgi:hypothetical protein